MFFYGSIKCLPGERDKKESNSKKESAKGKKKEKQRGLKGKTTSASEVQKSEVPSLKKKQEKERGV